MEGASLEFIFRVADDGQLLPLVQHAMAPLPTFGDKGHLHPAVAPEASDFAHELFPVMGESVGHR